MTPEQYRNIDLSQWVKVGEGGNGCTYEHPAEPDILLKVNVGQLNNLQAIRQEYTLSKAVADLGLPTPAMHEIVLADGQYGVLMQRIKHKKSIFRICHDEPGRMEEMAALFASLSRQLADTPCNTDFFPSRKETVLKGLEEAAFLSEKNKAWLRDFLADVPESKGCAHGDFQPGNVIISDGKPYWIDLGRFAWGDPMFDIGHLFISCVVHSKMKRARDIFHLTREQLLHFWDAFARNYTGKADHAAFDREAARYAAADLAMRVFYQKPNWAENIFFRLEFASLKRFQF